MVAHRASFTDGWVGGVVRVHQLWLRMSRLSFGIWMWGSAHQLWLRMTSSLPFVVVCCGPVTSCGCALPPPWAVRVVGLFVTSCGCARVLLARCGFGAGSPVVVAHVASLLRDMGAGCAHQLWLRMTSSPTFAVVCRDVVTSCGCALPPPCVPCGWSGGGSPVVVAHGSSSLGAGRDGRAHQLWLRTKASSVGRVTGGAGFTSCGCARGSPRRSAGSGAAHQLWLRTKLSSVGAVWRFHQLWLRTALSSSLGVDARRSPESPVVVAHAVTSSHRSRRHSADVVRRRPGRG